MFGRKKLNINESEQGEGSRFVELFGKMVDKAVIKHEIVKREGKEGTEVGEKRATGVAAPRGDPQWSKALVLKPARHAGIHLKKRRVCWGRDENHV